MSYCITIRAYFIKYTLPFKGLGSELSQQWQIKLIKSDSKDIYIVNKDFYLK